MKKLPLNLIIIALMATASNAALAADIGTLTTFTPNTPALASEVNGNFADVKEAVNTKADATDVTANDADIQANSDAIALKADATAVTANDADITALQQNGNATGVACAGNDPTDIMVRVGPLCVDKYEASVWTTADGLASGGSQLGNGSDNYNTKCDDTANGCTSANAIFARSEAGVNPSTNITWFQAQQACAASGKRLLTNAEWQMAAAGTTDPGATGDGVSACNISSGAVVTTGNSGANCESNWGAADMVGNVWEWVADWVQGDTSGPYTPSGGTAGASYGDDVQSGTNPATDPGGATNMMSALYRGGRYSAGSNAGVFAIVATGSPAFSDPSIGFRCAR